MQKLLEYLVTSIVQNPKEVMIKKEPQEGELEQYLIQVSPEDKGMVIGKAGRTIRSIRTLIRLKALKENRQVRVELVEDEPEPLALEDSPRV